MTDYHLTDDEHRAIELAGELADLVRQIIGDGPQAGNDWDELCAPIHLVQRTIGAQAAARAYPDRYRLLGQTLTPPPPAAPIATPPDWSAA